METVKTALEHPQQKPDVLNVVLSIIPASGVIAKAVYDTACAKPDLPSIVLAVAGVAVIAIQGFRLAEAYKKPHPFHDVALRYVRELLKEKDS